ncbi:hypothetical protein [Thermus sp.]|uniref:hypothetical protein n=1 Tax=Thermus sp. TaxID=275 RepID=UPI0026095307|nr:hypothetical protein [Thermus sp.]MCX7850870.1 BREX-1 system adenine-specific DNA-methyltransferase PglX [Thermus sp.]
MREEAERIVRRVEEALEAHYQAQVRALRAKEALEEAVARLTVEGAITGKNAEEREASRRYLLKDLYEEVTRAEEAVLLTRKDLEIARTWMRLIEVLAEKEREAAAF